MFLKLASRNIWRNKRRTLITLASIMFAVFFASVMMSVQKGMWDNLVRNVVNYHFGYLQVHKQGFWDEKTINKSFTWDETLQSELNKIEGINDLVPRIESFALANHQENTTGALVIGTDPEAENALTGLKKRIHKGEFFQADEQVLLIAEGLAEYLEVSVNDTVVLISQGYRGANAAGKYPVKGLIKFASPELNRQMIYMPLKEAQWFYAAEEKLTAVAVNLEEDDIGDVQEALSNMPGSEELDFMNWEEMLPELVQARKIDTAGTVIMLLVLYVIITFGIFGTVLMMTRERMYEFGILISIGLKRAQLAFIIWLETIWLGLLGALAGILISVPIVGYLHSNPIRLTGDMAEVYESYGVEPNIVTAFEFQIFVTQAIIVFIITTVLSVYPMLKIKSLQAVRAMRAKA